MLRKYCFDTDENWDVGLPFVVFASREAVQESLGFSPAELTFGHTPSGPLRALKERFLCFNESSKKSEKVYVNDFRKHLVVQTRRRAASVL